MHQVKSTIAVTVTNAGISLSSLGAANDGGHLHHPMHPHLTQDPLTGQTIVLGPMSTLVHTDQIGKNLENFPTITNTTYI